MAKDNLGTALIGLKEIEKKRSPHKPAKRRPAKRGRPKAFDPFYLLCTLLTVLAVGMQVLAVAVYS